jgi:aerobic carbon-monoxide dehydrogenase medium subunit
VTLGAVEWLAPSTLREAIALRAERGEEATVIAGGTFVGILINQGLLVPSALLSLGDVAELRGIEVVEGELRLGATVTHRAVERDPRVRAGWPMLARAFSLVASPRVRNQATVGGVLADADYASDPPAALQALGARAVLGSPGGERAVPVEELILGWYETCIRPEELLVEVRVPPSPALAVYRKFRSRSSEDRPCVAVAAVRSERGVRVVVGAVAGRPQEFADVCALAAGQELDARVAAEIGRGYAERLEPIGDARGSADYRRRVAGVEVRRALEALAA